MHILCSLVTIATYVSRVMSFEPWQPIEYHDEVCQLDTFSPSCPENHVILVKQAIYGHLRVGKCIDQDIGHFGCQADVTTITDRFCSGRRTCQLTMPHPEIAKTQPCSKAITTVLEVSYTCQAVFSPETRSCDKLPYYNITDKSGYLASTVSLDTGCGTHGTPWILNALPGQSINLTLYDFGLSGSRYISACRDYGTVQDDALANPLMICGDQRRKTQILHTTRTSVNISFTLLENGEPQYFMVYFEVMGCANEAATDLTWFRRTSENTATMGCVHSPVEWSLKCERQHWHGLRANCSLNMPPENHRGPSSSKISYGLAIAIILGAALVVCTLIVIIGIVRYRRRDQHDYNATYNTQTMLLRRHHANHRPALEEYELRCTCPVPTSGANVKMASSTCATPDMQRAADQQRIMTIRRGPLVPRHYSLKKTVEVESNDYEHIWQSAPSSKAKDKKVGSNLSVDMAKREVESTNRRHSSGERGDSLQNGPTKLAQNSPAKKAKINISETLQDNLNDIQQNTVGQKSPFVKSNSEHDTCSSSRPSSLKDKNTNAIDIKSGPIKPYYVTSKDILNSEGPKGNYGAIECSQSELKTVLNNNKNNNNEDPTDI